MTPEGLVKKEICDYLKSRGVYFWVNQAGKIPGRKLLKTGISDLLGVMSNGRILAIEIKSAKGKTTPEQIQFINDITQRKGLAFVAYSVSDVEEQLRGHFEGDLVTADVKSSI